MFTKSALALLFLASSIWSQTQPFTPQGSHNDGATLNDWVGTWSTSMHAPDLLVPGLANTGFTNRTLRQIIHTSIGGRRVRVRLSAFGANALTIGAAHIALRSAGTLIVPGSDRILTFGGKPTVTIPAGALILSDPVDLAVPSLGDLAISIFVPGNSGPATWHFEARQTTYISPSGDFTATPTLPVDATASAWFWLAGVEVTASKQTGAIVAFGDSITDGTQSTLNANSRWTDDLARRLIGQSGNQDTAVLNQGIAGTRLLHDVLGPSALARFDRDVLAQTGVTDVIVQMGNNDLFTLNPAEDVTADQVIQAHRQLIERARAKGLRIYACTLNPIEGFLVPGTPIPAFTPAGELKRQAVNAWIRFSGQYDAVFDFDQILRDPASPTHILALYDSGDHGHPTDAGYKALADAVNLKLFKNGESR